MWYYATVLTALENSGKNTYVGNLLLSALLLLTTVVPTFFNRSDIRIFDGEIILARSVTDNQILARGGWFEATIDTTTPQISAVGLVDHVNSTYTVQNGILTYQTSWKTFASISPTFGFFVQLNPAEIVLIGGGPYTQRYATIRVERNDNDILYYLNGQLMYVSNLEGHPSLRGCVTGSAGASDPLLERGEIVRGVL